MIALLLTAGAYAQILNTTEIEVIDNSLIPQRTASSQGTRAGTQLWLEYDSADAYNFSTIQSHTIQWIMNKRYKALTNPNTWQYFVVKFDSLYDINTMGAFPNSQVDDMTIDSIYTILGHQNNSGQNDTIIVKVLNVVNHYPGTNVLWSDTLITSVSLSPSQDWRRPVKVSWKPNFFSTTMKSFAVAIEFYGSFQDTCSFLSGFNNMGAAPNPYNTTCPYRANIGNFYPNSYAAWTSYSVAYPLLPDAAGLDLIQDCNQNGQFDDGIDGYNFIQDIVTGAYITVNSSIGVEELKNTGIGLSQNVPNPFNGITTLKYELMNNVKDVTLQVFDVVGREVMSVREGSRTQGKYSLSLNAGQLAKGIYTYTLRADGNQLSRRMIIE